ncbi:hypothetical protein QR680_012431 [Steinernema hermaphroditum]|uniref:Ephrin RBD domain-containing protein n=1 Tax=Steinernema hermaphroditum TaxID=289476 RepID=A0AA39I211_9BILA|nr:hypothetical protein QR680_012431 [Steinernema hermaphroditum]
MTLVLLLLLVATAQGKVLPDLDWNSRNPFFSEFRKPNGASAVVKAELFDELTIHCPFSGGQSPTEVSKIYMVSDMAYLNCQLDSSAELFLSCDQPNKPKNRKVVFRPYSPLPNGLEFAAGKSYYLISTSNGSFSGISNQHHGLCASDSLRLRVDVLASAPPTAAPSSAPLESTQKENPDPVLVYVSEHYNGDDADAPREEIPQKKEESVHTRNTRILRPSKPESLIDEASSRQLDLNLFRYVLSMAQNGAVGSVSFSNGEVKPEPSVVKEEPKRVDTRPPQKVSPKFRSQGRSSSDPLFTEKRIAPTEPDYVIQDIQDFPIQEGASTEPNGAPSLVGAGGTLLVAFLFVLGF